MNINLNEIVNLINECQDAKQLEEIKANYFGGNGEITKAMKTLRDMEENERKEAAKTINMAKETLMKAINEKMDALKQEALLLKNKEQQINIHLDAHQTNFGHPHVLNKIAEEISEFFQSKGYYIANGPEIESEENNFEKLNIPKTHPARDMQDSLYIDEEFLLRTHTSPTQVREMLKSNGELKLICPGDVFRRDEDDATHSHQFMQIEGLVLGKDITMQHLKTTLLDMAIFLFGEQTNIRMRPSYFPFTEPSVEVDVTCFNCNGDGCNICKKSGWIEILGAGMVHPKVLENCQIDGEQITGFAFGMGIDRVAMLKYQIKDIRDIYTNDLRFNKQFKNNGGIN